ncbi:hypothetical protein CLOSTASPAR_04971 [[Clostridium] asparagiforme DSM 15981]|uniref:Uncharacterized protein n=1 Tax=[Clostridium] asparagiforme DSM 15981 TaxID=518636 RepID=C0D6S4_9FIRM|nr:hypothetical protein CLOSTASPAR_04971 [[Clostridium] asparagiforme DSM 15981]
MTGRRACALRPAEKSLARLAGKSLGRLYGSRSPGPVPGIFQGFFNLF